MLRDFQALVSAAETRATKQRMKVRMVLMIIISKKLIGLLNAAKLSTTDAVLSARVDHSSYTWYPTKL
jgi:hypothetical protein